MIFNFCGFGILHNFLLLEDQIECISLIFNLLLFQVLLESWRNLSKVRLKNQMLEPILTTVSMDVQLGE